LTTPDPKQKEVVVDPRKNGNIIITYSYDE
jgi:hypothetical protein